MSSLSKGKEVKALREIKKGWSGTVVPEGARGRVIKAPLIGKATVEFKWSSVWGNDQQAEVEVDDDAVRKI